jgi:hypothetical protein
MDYFNRHLQHLAELARKPGFKAHAWARAKALDADTSGLFSGMAAALEREMTGQEKASESVGRELTKRP